jgi:uncharacterized protein (DUF2235 family)
MNYFQEGDRLFLFGFSRGAYTARAVASLLHMYGLIRKGDEPLVPYAIRMLMAINRAQGRTRANQPSQVRALFKLADEFNAHFSGTPCSPYFVGVWDTVSSVGWIENPLRLPYTANNPDIQIGRHAIAIDERRAFFRPNLWRPTATGGPRDLKQVWFPGVHCDVGGGYPEAESGLSKVALEWMLREAASAGLLTEPAKVNRVLGRSGDEYVPPDPKAAMHESLTAAWWGAEFIPKRYYNWDRHREERGMNLFRRRTIPDGSMIHHAAYQRGADYQKLLPAHAVRVS